jgi:hypothetical protein
MPDLTALHNNCSFLLSLVSIQTLKHETVFYYPVLQYQYYRFVANEADRF